MAMALLLLALSVCGGGDAPSPTPPPYNSFIGARELTVGENRFSFAIASLDGGVVENATVHLQFYSHQVESRTSGFAGPAAYRQAQGVTPHVHQDGELHEHLDVRGFYVVDAASFDAPGIWSASFTATSSQGESLHVADLAFNVTDASNVPNVGDPVPATQNPTVHDVAHIQEICTHSPPDDMHQLSVAQALEQHKPFVVVWSTPLFCVSAMCGPVSDVVISLEDSYRSRVNFLHIEPWDLELARNEGRLVPTGLVLEWGLPTEPWVFVVDAQGRVAARFEALVAGEEVRAALDRLLSS